jgi:hypothetical protein
MAEFLAEQVRIPVRTHVQAFRSNRPSTVASADYSRRGGAGDRLNEQPAEKQLWSPVKKWRDLSVNRIDPKILRQMQRGRTRSRAGIW